MKKFIISNFKVQISYISFFLLIIALISSFQLLTSGCKKFLDVPQTMNLPNNQAITSANDLNAILVGAYGTLQSSNVLTGNFLEFAELLCDDDNVDQADLVSFGDFEIYHLATTVQIHPLRYTW